MLLLKEKKRDQGSSLIYETLVLLRFIPISKNRRFFALIVFFWGADYESEICL